MYEKVVMDKQEGLCLLLEFCKLLSITAVTLVFFKVVLIFSNQDQACLTGNYAIIFDHHKHV